MQLVWMFETLVGAVLSATLLVFIFAFVVGDETYGNSPNDLSRTLNFKPSNWNVPITVGSEQWRGMRIEENVLLAGPINTIRDFENTFGKESFSQDVESRHDISAYEIIVYIGSSVKQIEHQAVVCPVRSGEVVMSLLILDDSSCETAKLSCSSPNDCTVHLTRRKRQALDPSRYTTPRSKRDIIIAHHAHPKKNRHMPIPIRIPDPRKPDVNNEIVPYTRVATTTNPPTTETPTTEKPTTENTTTVKTTTKQLTTEMPTTQPPPHPPTPPLNLVLIAVAVVVWFAVFNFAICVCALAAKTQRAFAV